MSYYNQKKSRKWPYITCGVVFLALLGYVEYMDKFHPSKCVDERTVVDITNVAYQSATIIDERGESHIINQGTFEKGGKVCLVYERR